MHSRANNMDKHKWLALTNGYALHLGVKEYSTSITTRKLTM